MINKQIVTSSFTKPYFTLGKYSVETENIWFIFHGYGQLADFFAKNFEAVANNKTFIIIPQAPSKFYNGFNFERVGATWLTKNDLEEEIQNNFNYLESIIQQQAIDLTKVKINGFGFSQGVSMLVRWLAHKNYKLNKLVLWAGQFPKSVLDFTNLQTPTKTYLLFGNKDPLKDQFNLQDEIAFIEDKLKTKVNFIEYEGAHKVNKEIISELFT